MLMISPNLHDHSMIFHVQPNIYHFFCSGYGVFCCIGEKYKEKSKFFRSFERNIVNVDRNIKKNNFFKSFGTKTNHVNRFDAIFFTLNIFDLFDFTPS